MNWDGEDTRGPNREQEHQIKGSKANQTKANSGLSGVQSRGSQKARRSRRTGDIRGREHATVGSGTTRHTRTDTRYTWKPGQCERRSFVPNVSFLHAFGR